MKILFASSEAHPLIKTGGLGDVSGSLPRAIKAMRHDIRLVLPAYRDARARAGRLTRVAELALPGAREPVGILRGRIPGTTIPLYLIDSPEHFDRAGNPYHASNGLEWPDNQFRFALFSRAISALALDEAGLNWRPAVVHCNDWQTALAPALLHTNPQRPKSVFTIHNLAYQGLFAAQALGELELDPALWSHEALEFHGELSFIKGGLVYADRLTTVSPTYAREIMTPQFGYGLEGLLTHRAQDLSGILNGIDYEAWDPARDEYLAAPYSAEDLTGKAANKQALQAAFGLPESPDTPVLGHIGRLVGQKGVDLILDALPDLLAKHALQLIILGTGERRLEQRAQALAAAYPGRIAVHIGYSEQLAHLIEAGSDIFVMPSRFEPCGLNQMYSLRYGTPPVVHLTGGLADTVVDANETNLAEDTANGFGFSDESAAGLGEALERALTLFADTPRWEALITRGMAEDLSWAQSAKQYISLYKSIS